MASWEGRCETRTGCSLKSTCGPRFGVPSSLTACDHVVCCGRGRDRLGLISIARELRARGWNLIAEISGQTVEDELIWDLLKQNTPAPCLPPNTIPGPSLCSLSNMTSRADQHHKGQPTSPSLPHN